MIFLTGATGFLGRHILHNLLNKHKCKVRVPVRKKSALLPQHPNLEVVEVSDLFSLNGVTLSKLVTGCDTILHAAWYTSPQDYLSSKENLHCLCGTIKLAEAFTATSGKHFVGIGSFFEYDDSVNYMSPDTPLLPKTLYAKTKVALSSVLEHYLSLSGCTFAWLRLFSVYGESPDCGEHAARLAPYIHGQLAKGQVATLSSGEQVRDYLEINDAAQQIVDITLSGYNGAANICSGKGISIRSLAEKIAAQYGRPDLLSFNTSKNRPSEASKIIGQPYVF